VAPFSKGHQNKLRDTMRMQDISTQRFSAQQAFRLPPPGLSAVPQCSTVHKPGKKCKGSVAKRSFVSACTMPSVKCTCRAKQHKSSVLILDICCSGQSPSRAPPGGGDRQSSSQEWLAQLRLLLTVHFTPEPYQRRKEGRRGQEHSQIKTGT
jgi:hypothetical protein